MAFFNTYLPSPKLAGLVDYYWRSVAQLADTLVQDVPTPIMQGMTFNLGGLKEEMVFVDRKLEMTTHSYFFGQPMAHRLSMSNQQGIDILGVKLKPSAIYVLTGVDMHHMVDDIVPIDDVWPKTEVRTLCEKLYACWEARSMIVVLEQFLLEKLRQRETLTKDPRILLAATGMEALRWNSMADIKEFTCFSERSLERHFKQRMGMSPKTYHRICRFNAMKARLDQAPSCSWQELAFTSGYYDQSHFIKEFKRFSGKTPGEYLAHANATAAAFF
ncbi:helix-turn-helix domain-containing protein [Parapedobacter sp. 10938]|uniref:helix-turn-helix domain-containing protein n=1 Tax=Parapedobacter flavus TaxID=3110225 RepID=UPI002DB77FEB|nr:helix-turn-helix domain-containing protein [Parapedobacter sp. 10938]MEC3881462.1 helix-turn-helix domain-containing protein [Parapedobacter sp. 10938]